MKFFDLCQQFEIQVDDMEPSEEKIIKLRDWCFEHITEDISQDPQKLQPYVYYKKMAETYLDGFVPNVIPEKIKETIHVFADRTAIETAVLSGYDRLLNRIKFDSYTLMRKDDNGNTLLHKAAGLGHYHCCKVLVKKGADATVANNHGAIPIFSALILPMQHDKALPNRKIAIFELLQDISGDPRNWTTKEGDTVFHKLVLHQEFQTIFKQLIKTHRAILLKENNHHNLPIHTAILHNQSMYIYKILAAINHEDLVNRFKQNVLHFSASHSAVEIVKECFRADLLEQTDLYGMTPLMIAAKFGNVDAFEFLLSEHASIHPTDKEGNNIFHLAMMNGKGKMMEYMIKNNIANRLAHKKNDAGNSCIMLSQQKILSPKVHNFFESLN